MPTSGPGWQSLIGRTAVQALLMTALLDLPAVVTAAPPSQNEGAPQAAANTNTPAPPNAIQPAPGAAPRPNTVPNGPPPGAPSMPAEISDAAFPNCAKEHLTVTRLADRISTLRHCRLELENFRTDEIEERGTRLDRYSAELVKYDGRNRDDEAKSRITADEYSRRADYVRTELEKLYPSGEYRDTYRAKLTKYHADVNYVVDEICRIQGFDPDEHPNRCKERR